MTAHQLAKELLAGPDIPVIINGWGSDEGFAFEVVLVEEYESQRFNSPLNVRGSVPKDNLGYPVPRPAIVLNYE